jgi:hypothetical protein
MPGQPAAGNHVSHANDRVHAAADSLASGPVSASAQVDNFLEEVLAN